MLPDTVYYVKGAVGIVYGGKINASQNPLFNRLDMMLGTDELGHQRKFNSDSAVVQKIRAWDHNILT